MLRDIEEMSTTDTANVLEITEETSRFASIERGRCCARVCTLVQEWNGKRLSISMPFGVTGL
jgi:hypothetical protein